MAIKHSKVEIRLKNGKPPVVTVTTSTKTGTLYRATQPLLDGISIADFVDMAHKETLQAEESHLKVTTNPTGVDVSSGVE